MMGDYDWRLADTNVWKVERMLLDYPHRPIVTSDARTNRLRARYRAFKKANPGRKPLFYRGRERWTDCRPAIGSAGSAQSRSKSRVGFVTGSWRACLSASSNRRDSASPRVFSESTDC